MDKQYIEIAIWAGVIGAVFVALWATGNLKRLRNYILETREELRKCSWPSVEELRGQTVLVFISVLLLGLFTVAVDYVLVFLVKVLATT